MTINNRTSNGTRDMTALHGWATGMIREFVTIWPSSKNNFTKVITINRLHYNTITILGV